MSVVIRYYSSLSDFGDLLLEDGFNLLTEGGVNIRLEGF